MHWQMLQKIMNTKYIHNKHRVILFSKHNDNNILKVMNLLNKNKSKENKICKIFAQHYSMFYGEKQQKKRLYHPYH